MKKCSYCGRENSEDAVTCYECGQEAFADGVAVRRPNQLFLRVAIGAGVGVAVTLLSLFVAWQNLRSATMMSAEQWRTRAHLRRLEEILKEWQKTNSAPVTNEVIRQVFGADAVDGWQRPFNPIQDGTNWAIVSYGRDGKPGGIGLDCDLTSRDPWPRQSWPTLLQFYLDTSSNGIAMSCILCGVLALITSLLTVRVPLLNRPEIIRACWRLSATVVGAVLVAMIISALHIPSGH